MRINTNIMALNAQNKLSGNQSAVEKSMKYTYKFKCILKLYGEKNKKIRKIRKNS